MSKKILIVSHDRIGKQMAGPAIRCIEFARILAEYTTVTLAVPDQSDELNIKGVSFVKYDYGGKQLLSIAAQSDTLILSGLTLAQFPGLADLEVPIVLDIYAPFNIENLEFLASGKIKNRVADHNKVLDLLCYQLRHADFFLCANDRQRDYWLGILSALNRVNPLTYNDDNTLQKLICVVPFGLPSTPPVHTQSVLKGVYPGIAVNDKVILWGGGIYEWFDPQILIQAVNQIVATRSDVKLVFMGVKHPNPNVRGFDKLKQLMALSKELGLTDRHVFFNDWVPYEARQNYLLEADIGVSLHLEHIETRYSFRTRILDYIWAGLPILATGGDGFADIIERNGLGRIVAPEDVNNVRDALIDMLAISDLGEKTKPQFSRVAGQLTWLTVTQPLIEFCLSPFFAADRFSQTKNTYPLPLRTFSDNEMPPPVFTQSWVERIIKGWRVLQEYGVSVFLYEVKNYLKWLRTRH